MHSAHSVALATTAERATLMATILVHGLITLLVLASPASFGNAAFYCLALAGLTYCNSIHWQRARVLLGQKRHAA